MRINPKIREKPAESRNKRPPKAMLFTIRVRFAVRIWRSQWFIGCDARMTERWSE
jgi:hypothetical protein